MIGIWNAADTVAVDLPLSTRPAERAEGAIAIVAGQQWATDADAALRDGAAALLVSEPVEVHPEVVAELDEEARRRGVPVAVERRRLEILAVERAPGGAIVAECAATDDEVGEVLRDTLGWVRRLAGSPLAFVEADETSHGSLALLASPTSSASLLLDVLTGVEDGGLLRVTALGVERHEVVVDLVARSAGLSIGSEGGTEHRAASLESPRRTALRRLVAALAERVALPELAELRQDELLAREIRADHRT